MPAACLVSAFSCVDATQLDSFSHLWHAGDYSGATMEATKRKAGQYNVSNRIERLMSHTYRYAFKGRSRLAADSGVARSTITRILDGRTRPTFVVLCRIARALETAIGKPIDLREIVTIDGTFPTPHACQLVGCKGCKPEKRYLDDLQRSPVVMPDVRGDRNKSTGSAELLARQEAK
jgi:transcriptional regulator with XRE-family HTH domain